MKMKNTTPEFKEKANNILQKKIPLFYFLLLLIIIAAGTYLLTKASVTEKLKAGLQTESEAGYNIKRLQGYKLIRPLLAAKPAEESIMYAGIKEKSAAIIGEMKDKGVLVSASVYMRDFDKANWMNVNGLDKYAPGSIFKIPVLLTILRMEEEKPGLLNERLTFRTTYPVDKSQNFVSKGIELGRSYTVKELLEYMIIHSDNNAGLLLSERMDKKILLRIFNDLNIKAPDSRNPAYPITARECSRFLEVLFNATYLSPRNSEFAMELLSKSLFNEGIVGGLPDKNPLIAHKFGEAGSDINRQLHETALLFINEKPYLLTIMTMGKDNVPFSELAKVIQSLAKTVYEGIQELNAAGV